ncbi:MAG: GNAT family N-acetyltransferase [Planctomycetes bacterium]|nr:GNAT family N-acetyltransferase [Planctomycetota bacterium]
MNHSTSRAALAQPPRFAPRVALQVEVVDNIVGLLPHLASWESLARRALAPNPFLEPWLLLPAARHLASSNELLFALVHDQDARLLGFFPLRKRSRFKGMPMRVLELWKHSNCFLCTPLLDADEAETALVALLSWARRDKIGSGLIDTPLVNGDGPFPQAFADACARLGQHALVDEHHERAFLKRTTSADQYLAATLSTGNCKELRRQRRRLAEQGHLESRTLRSGDDVDAWIRGFLDLEASGWKGKQATALANDASQRAFFTEMVREGTERGRVALLGLFLDGRPLALKCNLLAPPGAFAFKIAYDESFARFSPGTQLELDNIRWLHEQPNLLWMDSCAVAGHFMIERLWRERRVMQSSWLSTGRWAGNLVLAGLPLARAARRWLRCARS